MLACAQQFVGELIIEIDIYSVSSGVDTSRTVYGGWVIICLAEGVGIKFCGVQWSQQSVNVYVLRHILVYCVTENDSVNGNGEDAGLELQILSQGVEFLRKELEHSLAGDSSKRVVGKRSQKSITASRGYDIFWGILIYGQLK